MWFVVYGFAVRKRRRPCSFLEPLSPLESRTKAKALCVFQRSFSCAWFSHSFSLFSFVVPQFHLTLAAALQLSTTHAPCPPPSFFIPRPTPSPPPVTRPSPYLPTTRQPSPSFFNPSPYVQVRAILVHLPTIYLLPTERHWPRHGLIIFIVKFLSLTMEKKVDEG